MLWSIFVVLYTGQENSHCSVTGQKCSLPPIQVTAWTFWNKKNLLKSGVVCEEMSGKIDLENLKDVIRWEFNYNRSSTITHFLYLPLKKSPKKTRNKCSIWHLLTLRNYSQWNAVFSRQNNKYVISTADSLTTTTSHKSPSSNHAQMSAHCWPSIFQFPLSPNFLGESWTIPHKVAKLYTNHLLPHKLSFREQNKDFRHVFRIFFTSLQKWEKKACQWLCMGKVYFLCDFKNTSSFSA